MSTNKTQAKQLPQDAVMQSVLVNEVRIGNLLYNPISKEIVKLVAIEQGNRPITLGKRGTSSFSGFDCLLSLPLTSEWLINFGFYFENVFNQKQYFLSPITIYENKGKLQHSGYDRELKKVHELQNLYFALTGAELTVA